jgi:hypothetical protein
LSLIKTIFEIQNYLFIIGFALCGDNYHLKTKDKSKKSKQSEDPASAGTKVINEQTHLHLFRTFCFYPILFYYFC